MRTRIFQLTERDDGEGVLLSGSLSTFEDGTRVSAVEIPAEAIKDGLVCLLPGGSVPDGVSHGPIVEFLRYLAPYDESEREPEEDGEDEPEESVSKKTKTPKKGKAK